MKIKVINNELSSLVIFLKFIASRMEPKAFLRIVLTLFTVVGGVSLLGLQRHGLNSTFWTFLFSTALSPFILAFLFWTAVYCTQKEKEIYFHDSYFMYGKKKVNYSSIRTLEFTGPSNLTMVAYTFPFDFRVIGYQQHVYDEILAKIKKSGANPIVYYKKGFR